MVNMILFWYAFNLLTVKCTSVNQINNNRIIDVPNAKFPFDIRTLIDEAPAQPEAGRTALAKAEFDLAALAGKHLSR